ncbi:MAG: cytochrome c [Nitrospinota bacterium]|nr:cytochrome c [Nitrospinota bacterium]
MRNLALIFALVFIAGCENYDRNLWDQVSIKPQEGPKKFAPVRSIPAKGRRISYLGVDGVTIEAPFALDAKAAEKGKPLYAIYCETCHGPTGKADTPVAQKMETMPFDLTEEGTASLTDGELFVKILASESIMPRYRNELSDEEAWHVTAYLRKLQQ